MLLFNRTIKNVHIELTTNCNLACPQCPRTGVSGLNPYVEPAELRLNDIKRLFSPSDIQSLERIYACGNFGDPVIAKDVVEIFQYFRNSSPSVELRINTNGSLRNPTWWADLGQRFKDTPFYVVFAIDGLADTNHLYRRGANWDKLIKNIQAFIANGGQAVCDSLIFKHNEHQVEAIRELVDKLGFIAATTKHTNRPIPKNVTSLRKVTGNVRQEVAGKISCRALEWEEIFLDATGRWLPCCYVGVDMAKKEGFHLRDLPDALINELPFTQDQNVCHQVCTVDTEGKTQLDQSYKQVIWFKESPLKIKRRGKDDA